MRPSRWIPLIVICWGITQTLMGLVTNYHQLLALRALLGSVLGPKRPARPSSSVSLTPHSPSSSRFFECGLFPGLSFYLASWYPRRDLGLRIALFFSAATLAGAFGGSESPRSSATNDATATDPCSPFHLPSPSFSPSLPVLGYALSKMDGIGGKEGWSWIVSFVSRAASIRSAR